MTTSNIKRFFTAEQIPNYLIWYFKSDTTGKKSPIGEKNNEPIDKVISKNSINPSRPSSFWKKESTDEGDVYTEIDLSETEKQTLQKAYTGFLKYTENIYCVDIDMDSIKTIEDFIVQTGCDLFKNCPYIKGNTKGIHIYVKINNMPEYSNQVDVYNDFNGDLLRINNVWEKHSKEVYNYNGYLESFEFDDIKHIFNIDSLNFKTKEIKIKIPKTKKNISTLTDDQIKNNTSNELEKLKVMSQCFSKERLSNYDSYFKLTMAVKNSFGDSGKQVWEEICSRGDNYDSEKNNEQWYKYSPKTKEEKLLKFGSLVKWAKDDDPVKYEQLFGKKINWDLSEAEFAKALKRVCFDDGHVLFTGKGKEPEGYLYNDVYWVELSLHNAELKQKHFDNLYKYYTDALEKEKKNLEEAVYKALKSQVKTLNTNKTRSNILKIFQADNYVADVKWNKNKKLFVFENCVYDLETDSFVPSNPIDYINTSCGYKYDDTNSEEFEMAKKKIKDFVDSILLDTDRNYVWKLMGSSVIQSNAEEKAYFLLGAGRNGKGTLVKPFKNSLGKYWGDLNMNYYTTHDKGADTPNQNLYNCRNSRVVSSVEVSDSDAQNRAVKFVSDKFKTLSGNDTIYARELGTKNSAYFQAGKPFIQTNVMPVFTKLDTSLKERIVVINFPYTFKEIPLEPNEKKIDVKLKDEFEKEIYKTAMISLLFDYYKLYKKEGLVIPESVKLYTNTYFANECIQKWIDENLEKCIKKHIQLKEISTLYLEATDKKLTIKQLREELIGLGYSVTKNQGEYTLNGWKKNEEQNKPLNYEDNIANEEYNNEINEIEIAEFDIDEYELNEI